MYDCVFYIIFGFEYVDKMIFANAVQCSMFAVFAVIVHCFYFYSFSVARHSRTHFEP